jgi:hypothetical protein
VVVSLFLSSASCAFLPCPADVRITYFMPPSGIYYPGQAATSYFRLKNTGTGARTFWVDYGVRNQAEQWYDVTSYSVNLGPGEESPTRNAVWQVPEASSCMTGYYTAVMVVSDTQSEGGKAKPLVHREQQNSFQVLRLYEQFDNFDMNLWEESSHRLGKSHLRRKDVDISDGHVRIRIPADTLAGGEFSSVDSFRYGTYRASMLLPSVPGLVTGFFLYNDNGDEIDIEVYNDGDWQIEFTTWLRGDMTNSIKKALEFDPSADYHEYRIDFYPKQVSFFVDGQLWERYTSGLPTEEMKLLVNSWFPDWLPCSPPAADEYTYVDWIQY